MSYRGETSGSAGLFEDIIRRLRDLERLGRSISSGSVSYDLAVTNGYTGTYDEWLASNAGSTLWYGSGPPS